MTLKYHTIPLNLFILNSRIVCFYLKVLNLILEIFPMPPKPLTILQNGTRKSTLPSHTHALAIPPICGPRHWLQRMPYYARKPARLRPRPQPQREPSPFQIPLRSLHRILHMRSPYLSQRMRLRPRFPQRKSSLHPQSPQENVIWRQLRVGN